MKPADRSNLTGRVSGDPGHDDEVVPCDGSVDERGGEPALVRGPRNLAEEVGKRGAFDSAAQEAFLNLVRTQEELLSDFEQLFRLHGLSSSQYNALRILRGHSPRPLSCSTIAREMVTREPDITRLIDRLERAGFAKRQRCSEDRRVVKVRITEEALELLGRLDPLVHALHRTQLAHLSAEQLALLNELLFLARHPEFRKDGGR